jgi:hypothetical protein
LEKVTLETIARLSAASIQQYLRDHAFADEKALILRHKEIDGLPAALIATQISGRRKAKDKLPLFYSTSGIVYPPASNLEQSSSEATARFKSEILRGLLAPGAAKGADITGGFGVDTFFFSRMLKEIVYTEPDEVLLQMARHNHRILGADNITYNAETAADFIEGTGPCFDFIYIDPSRKTTSGKKIVTLENSEPDIVKLQVQLFEKAPLLLVKASPLLDIQAGMQQLAHVKKVYVVSVDNDCKEVLLLCEKNFSGVAQIEAVNLAEGRAAETFIFSLEEEQNLQSDFSDPLRYLYEPNASILKAGAFKTVGHRFGLRKIQVNTHLYTAEELVSHFPGRKFIIEKLVRPEPSVLKEFFPDGKANVTTRNYPLTAEALKKKSGLKDGGEAFLIGFSGRQKKFLAVAKRV